jgi:Sigma-70 factor, region 1.1
MTVEIETILQHEEIEALLENAEGTGQLRQPDLADVIETHQLDVLEVDLLYSELERRGIELVEEREKERPGGTRC